MDNDEYAHNPVPDDVALTEIANLSNEFIRLNRQIEALKEELSKKEKRFNYMSTVVIPDAMHQVGMTAFEIGNYYKIKIEPILVVKLDNKNVEEADAWLEANGHAGMVKRHIEVFVPKTIDKRDLENLKTGIEALGFEYMEKAGIHYQTLNKWSREMDAHGEVIPTDIFNVFRGTKTTIATKE